MKELKVTMKNGDEIFKKSFVSGIVFYLERASLIRTYDSIGKFYKRCYSYMVTGQGNTFD
jgi:hypothetical protein